MPHLPIKLTASRQNTIAATLARLVTGLGRICRPEPVPLSPRLQRDAGLIDEIPATDERTAAAVTVALLRNI